MPVKHCAWGTCNSDSRYFHRPEMKGVRFIPFPKPTNPIAIATAKIWISACGRQNFGLKNIKRHTYVCSKHFVGGNGPTTLNPHPISAICLTQVATAEPRKTRTPEILQPQTSFLIFNSTNYIDISKIENTRIQDEILPIIENTRTQDEILPIIENIRTQDEIIPIIENTNSKVEFIPEIQDENHKKASLIENIDFHKIKSQISKFWFSKINKNEMTLIHLEDITANIILYIHRDTNITTNLKIYGKEVKQCNPCVADLKFETETNILQLISRLETWKICETQKRKDFSYPCCQLISIESWCQSCKKYIVRRGENTSRSSKNVNNKYLSRDELIVKCTQLSKELRAERLKSQRQSKRLKKKISSYCLSAIENEKLFNPSLMF